MPTGHATIIGGSNAARRLSCLGSLNAEKAAPPSPPGYAAAEGTACHSIMESVLLGESEPEDHLKKTSKVDGFDVTITHDILAEKIDPALEAWDQVQDLHPVHPRADILVEPTVMHAEGAWGSTDVVWIDTGRWLNMIDWKFGRHYVSANSSHQLMFYLSATIFGSKRHFSARLLKSLRSTRGMIVQPLTSPVLRIEEYSLDKLQNYADLVHASIPKMVAKNAPRQAGSWCKWCRARATCAEFRADFEETIAQGWEEFDGTDLGLLKPTRDAAAAWVAEYDRREKEALTAGVEVIGRKLVRGHGRWKWLPNAERELLKAGLAREEIYKEPEMLSYSALKNKARGRKNVLDMLPDLAEKSEGGLTVADSDDSRDAVHPHLAGSDDSSEDAEALRNALGAMGSGWA